MNKLPRCSYVESQLAEIAGSTRETLYPLERLGAPKAQDRLRQMLKITSRATKKAGGDKRAIARFRAQPLPALAGGTVEALVKDGKAATLDHTALAALREACWNRHRAHDPRWLLRPTSGGGCDPRGSS